MTKKFSAAAKLTGLAFLLLSSGPALAQYMPPGQPVPVPKIVVIDLASVMRDSKVGQDMAKQFIALRQQAQKDLEGQKQSLQNEYRAAQQQAAILSPAMKQQKEREFQAKGMALQKKVEERGRLLEGGLLKARQQIDQALRPILEGIVKERGANLLVERNAILLSTVNINITDTAIARLNQKLPTVKVTLAPLPPGMQQQQQPQQQ